MELSVSKGKGITPHDVVADFPEAGIAFQQDLSSIPKTIEFTPTRVGTYSFCCSKGIPLFKNHREKAMEGLTEVVQ